MAAVLGAASCTNYANTGVVPCTVEPSIFSNAIAIPKGFVIPNASLITSAVLNAYITAKFITDSRSARWFLVPQMTDLKDDTGDPVTESRNNYKATVQSKPYDWTYRLNTKLCGYKSVFNLLQYKQDLFDFLFIDDMGTIIGTSAADATGAAGLGGFSMFEVFVADWTQKVANTNPMYHISFRLLNNTQMTTGSVMMQSNFTVANNTMGLVNVKLQQGAGTNTAAHIFVKGSMGCGGTLLGTDWGSVLNVTAAWLVFNTATGAAITVSAVSYSAITGDFDLTITSSTGVTAIVGMAAPSVLTVSPYGFYGITETTDKLTVILP